MNRWSTAPLMVVGRRPDSWEVRPTHGLTDLDARLLILEPIEGLRLAGPEAVPVDVSDAIRPPKVLRRVVARGVPHQAVVKGCLSGLIERGHLVEAFDRR